MEKFYTRYSLSDDDKERLHNWGSKAPNIDTYQPQRYKEINDSTRDLAKMLILYCPKGRQLSLSLTKLEEVRMWANNAISNEG